MKKSLGLPLLAGCLLLSPSARAGEIRTAPSFQGFTGLVNTPNAEVTRDGWIDLLYSNQTESMWRDEVPFQDNYAFSVGLVPWLEGGARLVEAPGEARDLSANFKVQLPPLVPYLPKIAFGMQDAKSSVPHFRTNYAVVSQRLGPLRLSLGYGTGPDRMEGLFGGGELQVLRWLQVVGEHDTEEWTAAARLLTPEGLLPFASVLGATAKTSLDHSPGTFEVAVSLQLPLGGPHARPPCPTSAGGSATDDGSGRAAAAEPGTAPAVARESEAPPPAPLPAPEAPPPGDPHGALARLSRELGRLGFENVRVGVRQGHVLAVEYENNRYNHNELDGLGLVLGTALAHAPEDLDSFVVWVKNGDIRVVEVSGPALPFRELFQGAGGDCLSRDARQALGSRLRVRNAPRAAELADVTWLGEEVNPRVLRTSLFLYPGLLNTVGTEVGVYDYRLSLKTDLFVSLWRGAELNLRGDVPVAWSDDYEEDGAFGDADGNSPKLERVFLDQAFPVLPGVMTLFGAGRYLEDLYGVMNETQWNPGLGAHRFRVRAGMFDGEDQDTREVLVGSYRYLFSPLDLSLEGSYGRYLGQDEGPLLEVRRFFGDTQFTLYYAHTDEKIAGFRISLPLTPRRDMRPGLVQVRGADRWAYGLETTIRPLGEGNRIVQGLAVVPQTTHNLERTYYNTDRLSEGYVESHLDRLREAYRRWGVKPEG